MQVFEVVADPKSIGVPIIRAINMDGDNCLPDPMCNRFDTEECNTDENFLFIFISFLYLSFSRYFSFNISLYT